MAEDLKASLLNCFVGGETMSAQPEGGWVRNKIELSFGGHNIKIIQRPWVISAELSKYRGQTVDTTTVVVSDVQVEQHEEILSLLQGLTWLLSFATCSDVALGGWEDHKGVESVVAYAGYFRPVFNIRDGKTIRTYLECVQQEYFRLEKTRQLRKAIHLLVLAETRSLPLELKLATMFILLENLKATHAQEQKYPFKENRYWQKPEKPEEKLKEKWTFKHLLKDMFEQINMISPDLSAIIDLRNEIIHSGISQISRERQQEIYERCQDLVREYLLRLLGYTGSFRLYSGRGMTVKWI